MQISLQVILNFSIKENYYVTIKDFAIGLIYRLTLMWIVFTHTIGPNDFDGNICVSKGNLYE